MTRRHGEDGSTVVEIALISLLLFTLLLGLVQFAIIEAGNSAGTNAARDGARVGIINTDCVDAYTGTTSPGGATDNGACTPDTNANYLALVAAVDGRLAGLATNPAITVGCYTSAGTQEPCVSPALASKDGLPTTDAFTPGSDTLQVAVTYGSDTTSPFVSSLSHTQTARMIIVGPIAISATTTTGPTTTSTSTTSTSSTTSTTAVTTTTVPSTTTTSSTTTTTAGCTITNLTSNSPNTVNGSSGHLSAAATVTITTSGSCPSMSVSIDGVAMTLSGGVWTINKNSWNGAGGTFQIVVFSAATEIDGNKYTYTVN